MVLKHKTQLTFLKLIAFVLSCGGSTRTNDLQVMSLASYQLLHSAMCFLISSAKIAHFPRTAKQIADYFRENANVTVSLPVERSVFFILQRWQAVIGPVQGYSLFGFFVGASSLR